MRASNERARIRKPKAVILVQAIGWFESAVFAIGAIRFGYRLATSTVTGQAALPLGLASAWRATVSGILLVMLLQIARRTQVGRLLGLALIALCALVPALRLGHPKGVDVVTTAYAVGWNGALLVVLALHAYWVYAFGFARAARAYFSEPKVPDATHDGASGGA